MHISVSRYYGFGPPYNFVRRSPNPDRTMSSCLAPAGFRFLTLVVCSMPTGAHRKEAVRGVAPEVTCRSNVAEKSRWVEPAG